MSCKKQELTLTKNDDGDSSFHPKETEVKPKSDDSPKDNGESIKDKLDDSKLVADAIPIDCGDINKETTDKSSKQADLNKSAEFDDEDDFNSDEMQLRWDDDDEAIEDEKSNAKELDNSVIKDAEMDNPSTSLVTAVKELESALLDSSSNNVTSPGNDKKDAVAKSNSSKEILDDIDKLIGNDVVDKIEKNTKDEIVKISPDFVGKCADDVIMSIDSGLEAEKTSNPKALAEPNNETDISLINPSEEVVESNKPTDTYYNIDESTESIEITGESLLSSTVNESLLQTNIGHGLKKPDMMLEIPTQELIDCMDDFDSDTEKSDEKVKSVDVSKQISSLDEDIDNKVLKSAEEINIQENTENNSESTDINVNENDTKQVGSSKKDIDPKIHDSEMNEQQNVENITEVTDQDMTESNNDVSMQEETAEPIQDVINDVEMCGISDKSDAVSPNTDSVKESVQNIEKLADILPADDNFKKTAEDSSMEVDEIKTTEIDQKSTHLETRDLENEIHGDANIKLHDTQSNEKADDKPQPLTDESTKPTTIIDAVERETTVIEDTQLAVTNVSETISKDNNIEITGNDTDISEESVLEKDKDINEQKLRELPTDTKSLENTEISQERNVEQQLEDVIPVITPSTEPAAPIIDQTCVKVERVEDPENYQTVVPKLEIFEEVNEYVKVEPSEDQLIKTEVMIPENTEDMITPMQDPSNLIESNVESITPTLDLVSSQQDLKDPVSDQVLMSAKSTLSAEVISTLDVITTEKEPTDPGLDQPSISGKSTSNKELISPTLEPIPTRQTAKDLVAEETCTSAKSTANIEPTLDEATTDLKSKDPILDEPSTSVASISKDLYNEESISVTLDSNTEDRTKDPVLDQPSTSKESSNIDTTPTLDPTTTEKQSIDPAKDQPLTSKPIDQIPDTTDELPEVEDTLGLLAESSRVVDADAEGSSEGGDAEDDDDGDDDDDFDPDDESSNQMTAEHSEESNAQPDKEDGQLDNEDKTLDQKKQFNFAIAAVTTAKEGEDGGKVEVTTEDTKAAGDVTVPTESTPAAAEAGIETDATDKEILAQERQSKETDAIKAETGAESETKANSILKELLCKQGQLPEMLSKKSKSSAEGVVDLSSSEDDEANKKKTGLDATSTDKDKEATSSLKDKPSEESPITPEDTENNDVPSVVDEARTERGKTKPAPSSEVFNLDSDDEDVAALANDKASGEKPESNKCINPSCRSGARTTYVLADAAARAYFDANKKKKHRVCLACAEAVAERTKGLVNGIKDFTPLLELDLRKVSSETVEISDSDSDNDDTETIQQDIIGEKGAKFLEEHLADVINETWLKYKLDERLGDAQSELDKELAKLEADSKEIDTMLNECQVATDLLRNQLYATFEPERRELTAICIMDTPMEKYSFCEQPKEQSATPDLRLKRKSMMPLEQVAKRAAIPLGYTALDSELDAKTPAESSAADDDKDVSVVKLSAESAPSDLPPPGEIVRQPLRAGMPVYAMRSSFCTWVLGKIVDIQPKIPGNPFTMCRVGFEAKQKTTMRVLAARCLAYMQPADVRLTIGTRVIALSQENAKADEATKKKTFYSGIVAEIPNPVNNYRYLIFFDHGYAQYVHHRDTRVVCESASLVWEEVHPNSREFVKQYLLAYPERPMVRLHAGQSLKTEWNGKWWVTKVLQVDASLVEVSFEDNRSEWIYRGSTRLAPLFLELQAAERQRSRPLPRSNQRRMNMPYVEYTRSEEQNKAEAAEKARQEQHNEEMRRQRAVAKKSTALPTPPPNQTSQSNLDSVTSRVVYYTPKNAVKPLKMVPHTCSPKCKRSDVLALKDLRTYNPLAKPLLSGWERQIVRFKGHKEVMYRAPCGRRLRNMRELHRYLRAIQSDMGVDLFDFGANTHCLAEFVLNKCLVGKKDLSHGKENVPVPCVNYYDESLPEFCSYNTERTPTAGVPLNLDPEFLCGCDCTDDCEDKTKCACWKMTLEGARTIGLQGTNMGYEYKRLPEPLPSGIYECNSRCKCKQTCLNRVAQHPLQLKLQVFKTMNRGWGIRALNDVPKGSFLCVYAGNLLTDATANLDGLNEGDEYLAELDYIEVVEQMKEGYEEDIPEADKKLDKESSKSSSSEEEPSSEEEDSANDKEDGDFQPGYIGLGLAEFNKRLRKRDRTKKKDAKKEAEKMKGKEIDKAMEDDGCITISDDEEAKEPTQFTAQTGIGTNEFVPKYKSVRTLFGKDEACYIMDAKVQGNIGRYLNHSCTPNVFVQNVFVDTHDPRFPWVAFFALSHIRAGTELTWNYNYDVGSVPGKVLYCYCGAPNCRGRLL